MSTRRNVSPATAALAQQVSGIVREGIPDSLREACMRSEFFFSVEFEMRHDLDRCNFCTDTCRRCRYDLRSDDRKTGCNGCTSQKDPRKGIMTAVPCRDGTCNKTLSWRDLANFGESARRHHAYGAVNTDTGLTTDWIKQYHMDGSEWAETDFGPFGCDAQGFREYLRLWNEVVTYTRRRSFDSGKLGGCHMHVGSSQMLIEAPRAIEDFDNKKRIVGLLAAYLADPISHIGVNNMYEAMLSGETPRPEFRTRLEGWAGHPPHQLDSSTAEHRKSYYVHPHTNDAAMGRHADHLEIRGFGGAGLNAIVAARIHYVLQTALEHQNKLWKADSIWDEIWMLCKKLNPYRRQKVTVADIPASLRKFIVKYVLGGLDNPDWDIRALLLKAWKGMRCEIDNGKFVHECMSTKQIREVTGRVAKSFGYRINRRKARTAATA